MNRSKEEIEDRATEIVNGYIKHWGTDISAYKMEHLDKLYYYLIYIHEKGRDIFEIGEDIYGEIFMIRP